MKAIAAKHQEFITTAIIAALVTDITFFSVDRHPLVQPEILIVISFFSTNRDFVWPFLRVLFHRLHGLCIDGICKTFESMQSF